MPVSTPSGTSAPAMRSSCLQRIRLEFLYLSLLMILVIVFQFKLPLGGFTSNLQQTELTYGVVSFSFRPSTEYLNQLQAQNLPEFIEQENEYFAMDDDKDESHDSHDVARITIHPAMQVFHDFQYRNSHHLMEEEELSCHERTNRGSDDSMAEIIDDGTWCPELHSRHYLVVDWVDPCESVDASHSMGKGGLQLLQTFLRSMAWGLATKRTVLFREQSASAYDKDESGVSDGDHASSDSCEGEECTKRYDLSDCQGKAKLDPWVPYYSSWKKEYGWDNSVMQSMTVESLLQRLAKGKDPNQSDDEDNDGTPKVIYLQNPPPLSMELLENVPGLSDAMHSLVEYENLYGMILDETILFKEPQIESWDSSDDEASRVRRYVVQASAARASKCSLAFVQPCVIYQIGSEAIDPSACTVEMVTKETDFDSHNAIFDIFALAGRALDGVVLDSKLGIKELLLEFLRYRGRMEADDYEVPGCWGDED